MEEMVRIVITLVSYRRSSIVNIQNLNMLLNELWQVTGHIFKKLR